MRILSAALLLAIPVLAQQTIFDVPSADVSLRGDWFYQHQTVVRAWGADRHWVQTNAYGYGAGHGTELDATWLNLEPGQARESVASFGFKTSIPIGAEGSKLPSRFVIGDMFLVSLAGQPGNWAYALLHTEIPRTRTRLTAGGHAGSSVMFGERAIGFLGGVEQPISAHWMLQADWFNGRHAMAYAIPGVVYRFRGHWMASMGYQLPNRNSHGYRAVVFELTRN